MHARLPFVLALVVGCGGSGDGSVANPNGTGGLDGAGQGGSSTGNGGTSGGTGGSTHGGATATGGSNAAGFPSSQGGGAGTAAKGGTTGGGASATGGASASGGAPGPGTGGVSGTSAAAGTTGAAGSGAAGGAAWTPYVVPPACAGHARIFTYNPVGDHYLTDAMGAKPSACADYYVHEPALAADKTSPRGPAAVDAVHAHGNQFHALAEFHWGGWSAVGGMTWYEKGVEFRKRMLDKGYDPARDTWAINELPSTTKSSAAVRQNVIDVVKGLSEGPPGSPAMGGLVFVIGIGSQTANFSVYKPALESWLVDAPFWNAMNAHVRWWSQEAYARPIDVCVGSATVAARAAHINDFAMHPAVLSNAGGAQSAAAHAFFDESYVPTQSAFWHADTYGTTITTLDNMKALVSTEVYASRAWAASHTYPDWRLALSWNDQLDGATEPEVIALATRIADSIHDAYAPGASTAADACSPSGAFTFCQCAAQNAVFNDGFVAFQTW